jgi:hypothetical protein
LLSLVQNGELWASKIQYMSDAKELSHALGIAQWHLKQPRSLGSVGERIRQEALKRIHGSAGVHWFAVSFSEDGDLLSQWRAYCPPGGGFSLGFDPELLLPNLRSQGFRLVKCLYDRRKQYALIGEIVGTWLTGVEGRYEAFLGREHSQVGGDERVALAKFTAGLVRQLGEVGCALKHWSFQEEREWRAVSVQPRSVDTLSYREGRSMLVPYVPIQLTASSARSPLVEVIVGPTPHVELSASSMTGFLRGAVPRQNVQVSRSATPYRSW